MLPGHRARPRWAAAGQQGAEGHRVPRARGRRLGQPLPEAASTLRAASPRTRPCGRPRLPHASRPLHLKDRRFYRPAGLPRPKLALMTPPRPAAAGRQQQPCYPEPRHDPEPHPAYRKSLVGKAPLAGDAVRKPQSQERARLPGGGAGAEPDGQFAHAR